MIIIAVTDIVYTFSADKKEAEKEIDLLQTKCTNMVKLAEPGAEEMLAKEKALHEQKLEELEKQLAKEQVRMKELEHSLAVEKAHITDTKVIVSKSVEGVPFLTHPREPQLMR